MSTEQGVALPRLAAGEVPSRLRWHLDLPPYACPEQIVAFPGRVALLADSGLLGDVYVLPADRRDAQAVAAGGGVGEVARETVSTYLRQKSGDLGPQLFAPERDISQNFYRRDLVLGVDIAGLRMQLGSERMRNPQAWQRALNTHLRREIGLAALENIIGKPLGMGLAVAAGTEILQHLPGNDIAYFNAHPLLLPLATTFAAAALQDVHLFLTARGRDIPHRDLPYSFAPFGLDRLARIGIATLCSRTIIGLANEVKE